jgi:hypothetical protein
MAIVPIEQMIKEQQQKIPRMSAKLINFTFYL